MHHSRITGDAQTILPDAVLAAPGLKEGDEVAFHIEGGCVVLTRAGAESPDDMFVGNFSTFTEWATEPDEKAYADL